MKQIAILLAASFTLIASGNCQTESSTVLPTSITTPEQVRFLTHVFNTSASNVLAIASSFNFSSTVPPDTITFNYWVPDDNAVLTITSQNASSVMDLSLPLIIIVHGWLNNGRAYWIRDMSIQFYRTRKCNVVSVDWSPISHGTYVPAATATNAIGYVIANLLLDLNKQQNKIISTAHLIGHSLGAQICGLTGKAVHSLSNNTETVYWITGLDAAGPLYEIPIPRPLEWKLTKGDAAFVDLIHTNIFLAGVALAYGDADFYINRGGPFQPQCPPVTGIISVIFCSHLLSYDYYSNSILKPTKYLSTLCTDAESFENGSCDNNEKVYLGEEVPKTARGLYFINDNSTESTFHPI